MNLSPSPHISLPCLVISTIKFKVAIPLTFCCRAQTNHLHLLQVKCVFIWLPFTVPFNSVLRSLFGQCQIVFQQVCWNSFNRHRGQSPNGWGIGGTSPLGQVNHSYAPGVFWKWADSKYLGYIGHAS